MDAESIDSEFSIIDAISSDEQSCKHSDQCGTSDTRKYFSRKSCYEDLKRDGGSKSDDDTSEDSSSSWDDPLFNSCKEEYNTPERGVGNALRDRDLDEENNLAHQTRKLALSKLDVLKLNQQLLLVNENLKAEKMDRERLLKMNNDLQNTFSKMKTRINHLDRELARERRCLDMANRHNKELKALCLDEKRSNKENVQLLRKQVKKLRQKQQATVLQYATTSSETDAASQTEVSRTASTNSLNEYSTIIEQKMEQIANSFSLQISQMQENITKLLPDQRNDQTNEDNSDDTSKADIECDGQELGTVSVITECPVKSDTGPVTKERLGTCSPTATSSCQEEDVAEPLDYSNRGLAAYFREMELPYIQHLPNQSGDSSEYQTTVHSDETSITEVMESLLAAVATAPEISEVTNSDNDPEVLTLTCSMCDYEVQGDYTLIAEHFSNVHVDKTCPLCEYTLPSGQDEQLNCHVQAHLDEEDAKLKAKPRRGWIFSTPEFD